MTIPDWQLLRPVSAIIFDCDGTLSTLEGIDYLAEQSGVGDLVKSITADAMGKTGLNPELYQQRLALVKPHKEQVLALGQAYFNHRVPDIDTVINMLQRQHKFIYLISAGLHPAVSIFGRLLQIPQENIFSVGIEFDTQENYIDFDKQSPLIYNDGKRKLVKQLLNQHEHMIYVGDGLNDLVTQDLVTRFIGYGGVFYRENIAVHCEYYIKTSSLTPLLPLALTQEEYEACGPDDKILYHKGLSAIQHGEVKVSKD